VTSVVASVVAAVIEDNHRAASGGPGPMPAFLVTRRQPGVHLAGMWEFPGGKIDPGETHGAALQRELREELDVEVKVHECVYQTTHAYPERTVELYFYRCSLKGVPRPLLGQEMRWVPRAELRSLGFPPADTELIELLTRSDAR
jgi:8-oxo-dGTP diphosphatase